MKTKDKEEDEEGKQDMITRPLIERKKMIGSRRYAASARMHTSRILNGILDMQ